MAKLDGKAVRDLVAQLPGAEERSHHGHPDFRVGDRIFATLWPAENRAVLRLVLADADGLARAKPDAYRLVSGRNGFGWLSVHLDQVTREVFQPLLEHAWRLRAPADVVSRGSAPP